VKKKEKKTKEKPCPSEQCLLIIRAAGEQSSKIEETAGRSRLPAVCKWHSWLGTSASSQRVCNEH
jgi:hypothetical protein